MSNQFTIDTSGIVPTLQVANDSSLCTQHKKVFTHEHILYTSSELSMHFATGDRVKDVSLTGFTGHPKCKFCNQSFYSLDEFTQHNREKHERCHVCDQINSRRGISDAQPRYFINYEELWKHFSTDHYPCGAPECLEQKFIVFASEIDLKAHIMEVHMGHASKAELRDMGRVDVNFQYNAPLGQRRRRERVEGSIGDVDISTLPRDEQAYFRIQRAQREMASRQVGNIAVPPVRNRGTEFPPLGSSSGSASTIAPVRQVVESFPPLEPSPGAPPPARPPQAPPPSNLPPEVSARHASVLEKAAKLLNNDAEKLTQFKSQVSSFRHSETTATELIDRLWDIFNAKLDEFSKLITSTADLFDYDAKPKRSELLGAWNDWRIQVHCRFLMRIDNQMQEADSTASSGFLPQQAQRSRILALKSSAKGRPNTSTQSVWNRIEAVAASRPVPSTSTVTQRLGAINLNSVTRPAVPWPGNPAPSTSAPRPLNRGQSPATRNTSLEEFPSLPTVKRRDKVALDAGSRPPRPVASWGPETRPSNTATETTETIETTKGKGKKKGKTVLFHVG